METVAKRLTGFKLCNNFKQHATNRVCKRTQRATSNIGGSIRPTMLRPFARGLRESRGLNTIYKIIFLLT